MKTLSGAPYKHSYIATRPRSAVGWLLLVSCNTEDLGPFWYMTNDNRFQPHRPQLHIIVSKHDSVKLDCSGHESSGLWICTVHVGTIADLISG